MKTILCPRKNCKNKAIIHPTFGVLPCQYHQDSDRKIPKRKFEFASISKSNRIQKERDSNSKDLLQPYEGNKASVDFFKAFPNEVDNYGVRTELESI